MKISKAALLLMASGIAASAGPALAQDGTVLGRVLDSASGEPVATASIRVVGTILVTFSDQSGAFLLAAVPAGPRRLSVERLGYAPQRIDIDVPAGGTAAVDISLEVRAVAVGEVVASVTKRELGSFDAPVSVSVQEAEDIRRRSPATVDEAVAYSPAVQFVGDQLNIRGSSGFARGIGTRVLLMMDGVPINAVDSGALNWDMIPLTEVERIEVVKGAGSALYGTSALGGVVNVVTADSHAEPRTQLRLRAGFYDDPPADVWIWSNRTLGFSSAEVAHGRKLGPVDFWARAGLADDDGYIQNDDSNRKNVALRLGLGDRGENRLRLFGTWAREDHGSSEVWCTRGECEDPNGLEFQPARIPVSALDDRTRSDKTLVYLTHEKRGRTLSTFERLSWQRNDWETDFGDSFTGAVSDRFGGEGRLGWQPWSAALFTVGVEGDYSDVDSQLSGAHTVSDAALFAQAEASLGPILTLTAGVRGDLIWVDGGSFSETYSEQVSPRLGLVFSPDALTRVRTSVGRGFRAPTVAELFTATEVAGFQVVPNPNLRPERSWAGEVGIQRVFTSWLALDVAGFFYDFDQLIQADTTLQATGNILVTFGNLPESSVQGVEAIGRLSFFAEKLQGQVAYTYLDTEDKETGEPLPYRPEHLVTAAGTLFLGSLELGADYRFAKAFERVEVFTDPRTDPRVDMSVLDLRLAYRIGRQTIRFNVDNAANYGYNTVERNLEPIRHYSVALELDF